MRTLLRHRTATIATATAAALALAIGATFTAEAEDQKNPNSLPTKQEIEAQFDLWEQAIETGDPEKVADRYAPDAVLVPTLSNVVRTDRAGIVDYFIGFEAKHPIARILESHVKVLGKNTAVDSGAYRFFLTNEDGERQPVDARFTFVYERDGKTGEWFIQTHHSSVMPEQASTSS